MPILIFLVIVVLIAQIGFWDTLQVIIGGVAMIVLLIALAGSLAGLVIYLAVRRLWRP